MPRKKKVKSKRKQDAIRHNAGIAAWRKAAAEYLRTGRFVHLPRKGSPEHEKMLKRQADLLPLVKIEIAAMIKREKEEDRQRRQANAAKHQREIARLKAARVIQPIDILPDTKRDIPMADLVLSESDGEEAVPLNSDLEEYIHDYSDDSDAVCSEVDDEYKDTDWA
jgi:hypothetical protein